MEDSLYRISVKGLIGDGQGRYLVIRTTEAGWELPGGGMDHGEEPHSALARELREELGVDVTIKAENPVYVSSDLTKHGKRAGMWRLWLVYNAEVDVDQIIIGDSVDALDWIFIDIRTLTQEDIDPTEYKLFYELQNAKL
jgi:8-oxo-dGTP pyrophosphatase MutT (NUDIX family)